MKWLLLLRFSHFVHIRPSIKVWPLAVPIFSLAVHPHAFSCFPTITDYISAISPSYTRLFPPCSKPTYASSAPLPPLDHCDLFVYRP